MKKALWIIGLLILAAVLYFSFHKGSEPIAEETPVADSTYLKIGVLPTSECLPFLVAVDQGIADSLGLKLHVELFDAAMDADTAFQKGYMDGIVSDMVKLSIMESNGDSVHAVMGGDIQLSLMTTRQSRINDVKNLKEKIVSITRNSVIDLFADKLLSTEKLESYDLNKPQINSLPIRYGMLCQNEYDGAILPEPWASMSASKGCHRLSVSSVITGMEKMFVLVVHDSIEAHRSSDVAKLIQAYNKSADYIKQHQRAETKIFLSLLGIKDNFNDSIFDKCSFDHASAASEGSLSAARSWCKNRNLLGTKHSNVIDKTK